MTSKAEAARRLRQEWRRKRIRVGDRLIAPVPTERHGKATTYSYYGCQCDPCRDAGRPKASRRTESASPVSAPSEPAVAAPTATTEPVTPVPPVRPPEFAPAFAAPVAEEPEEVEDVESEPAVEERAEEPAPEPEGDPVPNMTPGVRARIGTSEELSAVLEAYHRPQVVTPAVGQDEVEIRSTDGCTIRVHRGTGAILFVADHEAATGEPELLREHREPKRRKRGGGGKRTPTSLREVVDRLRDRGCTVIDEHGHYRVELPDGQVRQLPRSATTGRTIPNIVTKFARAGVDLRRPA